MMSHRHGMRCVLPLATVLLVSVAILEPAIGAPYVALTAGRTSGKDESPATLLGVRIGAAVEAFGFNIGFVNAQFQLPGQEETSASLLSFGLEILPLRPQLSKSFWSRIGVFGEGGWADGTTNFFSGGLVLSMLNGIEPHCNPSDSTRVFPRYFWGANVKVGFVSSLGSAPLNGWMVALELPVIMNAIPDGWPSCR